MTTFTEFAVELKEMATKAKVTPDQCLNVLAEVEARESRIRDSRRASDDERERIDNCIRALDGELKDLSPSDILVRANVTKKMGTSAYASRQKRLLLTHQK